MNGVRLPVVKQFKDLGITFCDNLSFNIHINSICSKAYILINIICRCFINNDYVFLLQAYISYVRRILNYNSSIWNHHTNYIGNAKAPEIVQRLFTKILFYRCNISMAPYSNRLLYFNIKSLSHRRLISDMVLAYKILNGLVDVEATSIFYTYISQCRGPLIKLRPRKCKSIYYLNYFGNRVSSLWNSLPNM